MGRHYHNPDDVIPVELMITGELVAQLCIICWAQLPADWSWMDDIHMESIRG